MSHRFVRVVLTLVVGLSPWRHCIALLLLGLMFLPGRVCARALENAPIRPISDAEALGRNAANAPIVFSNRLHYVGQNWLVVTSYGILGTESGGNSFTCDEDPNCPELGYYPSWEFPAGTRADYLFKGGYWFGGIVGNDTLVSTAISGGSVQSDELNSFAPIKVASTRRSSPFYDPGSMDSLLLEHCSTDSLKKYYYYLNARADQQYYAKFSDTLVLNATDEVEGRRHRPLGLEVSQTSYAWPDSFAQQFVIVELWIKNISGDMGNPHAISNFVMGVFMDYDILNKIAPAAGGVAGYDDDISGYLSSGANLLCPDAVDPLNVAWAADNDGDPSGDKFPSSSTHGIVGIRFLRSPATKGMSFNWWTLSDPQWGPAKLGSGDPVGIPDGDRRRYYLMANRTIDYGQVYSAIDFSSDGWRKPPGGACGIADGLDTRQVTAVGPLEDDLLPGDSIRIAFALLGGNNFHTDPLQTFVCKDPDGFLAKKDFGQLSFAAQWASWIYDTPGFDTDCDGYAGEFHDDCNCKRIVKPDTIYTICSDPIPFVGDMGPAPGPQQTATRHEGLPDLQGPEAPPCPSPSAQELTAETRPSQVILRWSGKSSETTKDHLSRRYDFEGYRVYVGRENSPDRYSLLASWDKEDYKQFIYDIRQGMWTTNGNVLSLGDIRRMTGDSQFDPKRFSRPSLDPGSCYQDSGRCSYFEPQAENFGDTLYVTDVTPSGDTVIQKIANLIQRVSLDTIVIQGDTLTYGEFQLTVDKLPTYQQYFSVTAFDVGDPVVGLPPLESPRGGCYQAVVPIYSADVARDSGLKVSVFPNPYKISFRGSDGRMTSYFEQGYEAPEKEGGRNGAVTEMDRRINFINLPEKATINIYTLDGDLVRTIEHPDKVLSSYSSMASWDLVSRNLQAVVSGIYLYRVDAPGRPSQVGKIVIIK